MFDKTSIKLTLWAAIATVGTEISAICLLILFSGRIGAVADFMVTLYMLIHLPAVLLASGLHIPEGIADGVFIHAVTTVELFVAFWLILYGIRYFRTRHAV